MTLPQNVEDAVKLPIAVERCMVIMDSHADAMAAWQTIRSHLMSQEAEIARLREIIAQCAREVGASISPACSAQFLSDVPAEIRAVRRKDKDRLAAANALLREVSVTAGQSYDMTVVLQHIQSHLQGAGDEG